MGERFDIIIFIIAVVFINYLLLFIQFVKHFYAKVMKPIVELSRVLQEKHSWQIWPSRDIPFPSALWWCFKCLVFHRLQPATFLSIFLNWVQIHLCSSLTNHVNFNHMNNLFLLSVVLTDLKMHLHSLLDQCVN